MLRLLRYILRLRSFSPVEAADNVWDEQDCPAVPPPSTGNHGGQGVEQFGQVNLNRIEQATQGIDLGHSKERQRSKGLSR